MISIFTFVEAIWLVLPAYGANGLASLSRGKRPIDDGRKFRGHPIFGKGKTWEGLILGIIVAMIVSTIQMFAFPYLPWELSEIPLEIVPMTPLFGALLGLGAMLGDIAGSFVKRRIGIKRGGPAPILDQDDFIAGMLISASFAITLKLDWIIILLAVTPVLHLIANGIAFMIKVKKEPY